MTTADRKLIDETIRKYGDNYFWNWNDPNDSKDSNKGWVIDELLEILAKDDLDLKVVRKVD